MEVDKTSEIPATFDVLRLSLNITLKDDEVEIETQESKQTPTHENIMKRA